LRLAATVTVQWLHAAAEERGVSGRVGSSGVADEGESDAVLWWSFIVKVCKAATRPRDHEGRRAHDTTTRRRALKGFTCNIRGDGSGAADRIMVNRIRLSFAKIAHYCSPYFN
jgi:hypothetical protein